MDALHNFLLAYVEDCINSPINQEDRADSAPAARVLREGFSATDESLSAIKAIVRSRKERAETLFDPQDVFQDFLRNVGIDENDLFALCSRRPELDQVRDTLVVNLTPRAKGALDKVVSKMSNRVIRRATVIARKRQGRTISENDVKQAIRDLEEEQK